MDFKKYYDDWFSSYRICIIGYPRRPPGRVTAKPHQPFYGVTHHWVTLQKYNILSFQFFSFNLSLLISSLHGLAPPWLGEFIMLKLNFSGKVTRASTRGSEIIIIIQLLYIKQQLKRDHICEHSFYANYVLSVIFHGVRLLIYFLCIFVCTMDFYLLFMDFYVVILCISYLDYIVVHCLVVFLFFLNIFFLFIVLKFKSWLPLLPVYAWM